MLLHNSVTQMGNLIETCAIVNHELAHAGYLIFFASILNLMLHTGNKYRKSHLCSMLDKCCLKMDE